MYKNFRSKYLEGNCHSGGQAKNNIKMDIKELGCDSMDYIYLAQNWVRLRAPCEDGNKQLCYIKEDISSLGVLLTSS
jgi:hypothetical protein